VTICPLITKIFNFGGEAGRVGEGEVKGIGGEVDRKKEEQRKEKIDMKICTKFQINPSTYS
jgi:hypothetical protein